MTAALIVEYCTLTELPVDGCACKNHRNSPELEPPAKVTIVERDVTR